MKAVLNANEIQAALLEAVVLTALTAVRTAPIHFELKQRWARAINAAQTELSDNPFFKYENGTLLILSDTSTTLYEVLADGHHKGCRAFDLGQPCRHRAARRLLDLYVEAAALPQLQPARSAATPDRFAAREAALLTPLTRRGERWAGSSIEF